MPKLPGAYLYRGFIPPSALRLVSLVRYSSQEEQTPAPEAVELDPDVFRDIPTEVLLTPEEDGVPSLCVVNLDNLQTVQKRRLGPVITTLSYRRMQDVQKAIQFALGMDDFL